MENIATKSLDFEGALIDSDISLYIRHTLEDDKRLRRWPTEVKEEVEAALVNGAHGMFRWVFCQIDSLKKCLKLGSLRKALKSLPTTLDETYSRILQSIHEDYRGDACRILRWLVFSIEPMSLDAMAEVLAITEDDVPAFDPQNRLPDPADILTICSSLVTVTLLPVGDSKDTKQRNVVQLAQFSVKEYLLSDRILAMPKYNFEIAKDAQQHLARDYIAYLIAFQEHGVECKTNESFQEFPLLRHASQHWHRYCHGDNLDTCVARIAKLFLTGNLLAYKTACSLAKHGDTDPLSFSCSVQSPGLVTLLIREGADVNTCKGRPLRWAGDNTQIIELLLDAGADMNLTSLGELPGTALQKAVSRGSFKTVELLIEKGVEVNLNRKPGGFALKDAAFIADESKAIEMLQLLLDNGADINLDEQGTALTTSISLRSRNVARFLIERGADLELRDSWQRTPLALATVKGSHEIVKILLEGGANIDPPRKRGERPLLHEAAYYGYDAIVRDFLKHNADVNMRGGRLNQTAVEAAVQGYVDLGSSQTTSCNWEEVIVALLSSKPVLDTKNETFQGVIKALRGALPPRQLRYFSELEDTSVEQWKRRHNAILSLIQKACIGQI